MGYRDKFSSLRTKISLAVIVAFTVALTPATAFAHSKVTPNETGVAKEETFMTTVENEKEIPTTKVRLVLPDGLSQVEPYAKAGWTVETTKSGAVVTEITWSGGTITGELKDTFLFDAKVPAEETKLTWKIYQTYEDGSVVAWENTDTNAADSDGENVGPASYTQVVNDFAEDKSPDVSSNTQVYAAALLLGITGTTLGIIALVKRK